MGKERIHALIALLDDPNEEVFNSIESELLKEEVIIVPQLEQAWECSQNNLFQQRIENIIHTLQLKDLKNQLTQWVKAPGEDLLKGAWLIARFQYPDLTFDQVNHAVNNLRKDVWLEISEHLTALEKVRIMNHILFDVHGFSRNDSQQMTPQNFFVWDVLNTKKGNPVSLAIIYSVIAQRLGLPVFGVNLPKNFLLAYLDEASMSAEPDYSDTSSVLFYINPINKGAVLGRKEIENFIRYQKLEPRLSYFVPCSNVDIVRRVFRNLLLAYESTGQSRKIKEIRELIAILDE